MASGILPKGSPPTATVARGCGERVPCPCGYGARVRPRHPLALRAWASGNASHPHLHRAHYITSTGHLHLYTEVSIKQLQEVHARCILRVRLRGQSLLFTQLQTRNQFTLIALAAWGLAEGASLPGLLWAALGQTFAAIHVLFADVSSGEERPQWSKRP